jgi:hypothetical protein
MTIRVISGGIPAMPFGVEKELLSLNVARIVISAPFNKCILK